MLECSISAIDRSFLGSKIYALNIKLFHFSWEKGEALKTSPSSNSLTIKVVNPSHCLNVAHRPKIALCSRKVCMPENHFADNFNRNA